MGLNRNLTCAENESDTEKHSDASDTKALLPPLELHPVGESGSAARHRRLYGEEEEDEEEEEEAGLWRKNSACEGLRVGVASRGKAGPRGGEWRKEGGD